MRTTAEKGGVAVAALPDTPLVVEIVEEEISQPLVHIIEPAAGNRIVAAIEVLSPDNKRAGPGRESFLRKREELGRAGAHSVELDLLRDGERSFEIEADDFAGKMVDVSRWQYVVTVTRRPRYCEFYPATVRAAPAAGWHPVGP